MTDQPTIGRPVETVSEHLLIQQLGIPLKKMRRMRPATVEVTPEGVFWPLTDARALATHHGIAFSLPEKTAPDTTEELTVVSTSKGADGRHFANPNVIEAVRKNGARVFVRVVHSKKYRPTLRIGGAPMVFKAKPAIVGTNWVLVGREPAYPAQW